MTIHASVNSTYGQLCNCILDIFGLSSFIQFVLDTSPSLVDSEI
jgi:hypothetical protein